MNQNILLNAHGKSAHGNNVSCHAVLARILETKPIRILYTVCVSVSIAKSAFCRAFSLIEIMLGLIVISVMVAAFAPVITKKVTNTSVALSQQDYVAGKRINYKIFNYDPTKNGIDGCSIVTTTPGNGKYLQCPFEIPEGVDKIGVALIGGGGGGGGSLDNQISPVSKHTYMHGDWEIPITKYMQNVKISKLVGAAGGGGGGYYYYKYNPAEYISPTSQSDCTSADANSTYVASTHSCVTKYNVTPSDVPSANVAKLKTNSSYSANMGNSLCWEGTMGYSEVSTTGTTTKLMEGSSNTHSYTVCTAGAAYELCNKYGKGNNIGRWRPISSTEGDYIRTNQDSFNVPEVYTPFKKGTVANTLLTGLKNPKLDFYCDPGNTVSSKPVIQAYDKSSGKYHYSTLETIFNPCLPQYAWTNGDMVAHTSTDNYVLINNKLKKYDFQKVYSHANVKSNVTTKEVILNMRLINSTPYYDNGSDGKGTTISNRGAIYITDKSYLPLSVRCALDYTTIIPESYTYNYSSGGGGASGALLSDVTIPQSVISANIGGKIVLSDGVSGKGGKASTNGGTATNGANGEKSYVYVYNTAGKIVWGLSIDGSRGGKAGSSGSSAQGGVAISYYTFHEPYMGGTASTGYGNNTPLRNGKISSTGSFTSGANGASGTYSNTLDSATGGLGGESRYAIFGKGGSGGNAGNQTAQNGDYGSGGYVELTYDEVYEGAPGGGGGGAGFIKVKDIPVKEGDKHYVRVGGGGAAGVDVNGSWGGESAFCKTSSCNSGFYYRSQGGAGGSIGTRQTVTANPVGGEKGLSGSMKNSGITPVIYTLGGDGEKGWISTKYIGGNGGHSGINKYLLSKDANSYSTLFNSCGGYNSTNSKDSTYHCSNGSIPYAIYVGDIFANPGKIHRDDSIKFGSAGSGGGGGGIYAPTNQAGSAKPGQDGYVYLWWEEYD